MTPQEVFGQIARIISSQLNVHESSITRETTADDVPGWDSITHVYIILEVERKFGIKLPADEVFSLANVGEIADLTMKNSQGAA